jgi:hypothetical protein
MSLFRLVDLFLTDFIHKLISRDIPQVIHSFAAFSQGCNPDRIQKTGNRETARPCAAAGI